MAKRETPEINAGSMADIAFLLLSFFLLTTTMDQNKGMARRLPPMTEDKQVDQDVNKRNVLLVHVSKSDALMVNTKIMDVSMLKAEVRDFITNPTDDPSKSAKKVKEVKYLGNMAVSQAVISLNTDRGTSYRMYMSVQNEIMKAYAELRNEFATERFGKLYSDLDEDQQEAVRDVYPLNISEAEPRNTAKK